MPFHLSQSNLRAHCGAELRKRKKKSHSPPGSSEDYSSSRPHPPHLSSPRPGLGVFPWVLGVPPTAGQCGPKTSRYTLPGKDAQPPPATPFRRGKSERTKGQDNKQATTHTAHRSALALRTGVFCEKEKSAHCDQRGQLTVFTCEAKKQFSFRSISTRKPPLIKKNKC